MKEFLNYQGKKYYKFYNCNNCAKFVLFYNDNCDNKYVNNHFNKLDHIDMNYIKDCYLNILLNIPNQEKWNEIYKNYHNKNCIFVISDFRNTILHQIRIIFKKSKFLNFIKRRQNKEPIAYIINKKEFWRNEFFVNIVRLANPPITIARTGNARCQK